tara:strand:- start:1300 stop:1485 length:186 start_codon:yes stop_codon:yes gene_type:complete
MSLEKDAATYVKALRNPANGWGQYIINGEQSHVFLGEMFKQYGEDKVNNFLKNNYWSKERD